MSDLTTMAEYIHDAMQAVEEAQRASRDLKENANHETFDAFRAKMLELRERLRRLKAVLDDEEAYAMDELADALSKVYTDHRAEYRKTPRMEEEP